MGSARWGRTAFSNFHYWGGALLALGVLPFFKKFDLPLRVDWARLLFDYWIVLTPQSIVVASLLYLLGFPKNRTKVFWQRFRRDKARIIFIIAFFAVLAWTLTWMKALIVTVDSVALLELRERIPAGRRAKAVFTVLLPALYLFLGFLLVFSYNDIILSWRFYGSADEAFNRMDAWLMHGTTVSAMCHWAVRTFSVSFFRFLNFIYLGMFLEIGAALVLTSLVSGRACGLRFVGTLLTAYYLALIVFAIWPSQGPYYLCPIHFSNFPSVLQSYSLQKQSLEKSQELWNHVRIRYISADYYIAFPCMHIAQPLIVMWFLRRWKVITAILAAYNTVLVVAILLLEWHYVVDVLGGILLAVCAIVLAGGVGHSLMPINDEPNGLGNAA